MVRAKYTNPSISALERASSKKAGKAPSKDAIVASAVKRGKSAATASLKSKVKASRRSKYIEDEAEEASSDEEDERKEAVESSSDEDEDEPEPEYNASSSDSESDDEETMHDARVVDRPSVRETMKLSTSKKKKKTSKKVAKVGADGKPQRRRPKPSKVQMINQRSMLHEKFVNLKGHGVRIADMKFGRSKAFATHALLHAVGPEKMPTLGDKVVAGTVGDVVSLVRSKIMPHARDMMVDSRPAFKSDLEAQKWSFHSTMRPSALRHAFVQHWRQTDPIGTDSVAEFDRIVAELEASPEDVAKRAKRESSAKDAAATARCARIIKDLEEKEKSEKLNADERKCLVEMQTMLLERERAQLKEKRDDKRSAIKAAELTSKKIKEHDIPTLRIAIADLKDEDASNDKSIAWLKAVIASTHDERSQAAELVKEAYQLTLGKLDPKEKTKRRKELISARSKRNEKQRELNVLEKRLVMRTANIAAHPLTIERKKAQLVAIAEQNAKRALDLLGLEDAIKKLTSSVKAGKRDTKKVAHDDAMDESQ